MIISLWIAAILVLFTFGLAQRASLSLKIARNQKNRLKAYNLAKAGINKAIMLAEEDSKDSESKLYDSLSECGVHLENKQPKEIFRENLSGIEEGFEVGFYNTGHEFIYGMNDEEGKINIASKFLAGLFEKYGVEGGNELAKTINAWVSQDSQLASLGNKEIPKKEPLNTPEELILIMEYFYSAKNNLDAKEKARQQYEKIKGFITIYGDQKINVNTATRESLEILASVLSLENNLQINSDALAKLIIELRDNNPKRKFYNQIGELDKDIQENDGLDQGQKIFFSNIMMPYLKCNSDFLKICSRGYTANISRQITIVYARKTKKPVYWHEN